MCFNRGTVLHTEFMKIECNRNFISDRVRKYIYY